MSSVIVTAGSDEDVDFSDGDDMVDVKETKSSRRRNNKTKGRGFGSTFDDNDRYTGQSGNFEVVIDGKNKNKKVQKSVEGYVIVITNVHEEAQEDDIYDVFADYGEIKQIHLNLDRRTGYVKGYSLIEYEHYEEASSAIEALDGSELLEQVIGVTWAFKPSGGKSGRAVSRR